MPITILSVDPFIPQNEADARSVVAGSQVNVRRPLDGLQQKEQVFASIAVFQEPTASGGYRPISLINSSAPGGYGVANHNFLLRSISESRQEKAQIVETFGATFLYFFGERSTIKEVQGILLNTDNFNWKSEWLKNYNKYLRGSACVRNRARLVLSYGDRLVEGYLLSTTTSEMDEQPMMCPFSFTMFVTRDEDISNPTVTQQEDAASYPSEPNPEYLSPVLDEGRWVPDGPLGESRQTLFTGSDNYNQQLAGTSALFRQFQADAALRRSSAMTAVQIALTPVEETSANGSSSSAGRNVRVGASGAFRTTS